MVRVEVFGMGCAKCAALKALVRKVVGELGVEAEVVEVTDIGAIVERGVMLTPALAVDGDLRCSGRVPSEAEVRRWLG